MTTTLYAIAIGSNRAGRAARSPAAMVTAAMAALDDGPLCLLDASPIIMTPPLGPSRRRYANCAALVASTAMPDAVLAQLHRIEAEFGRRRQRRWGERALDLDLILWSEGSFAQDGTIVPHLAFRARDFVLRPLAHIAPLWRDPITGLTVRQLMARQRRAKPVDHTGTGD